MIYLTNEARLNMEQLGMKDEDVESLYKVVQDTNRFLKKYGKESVKSAELSNALQSRGKEDDGEQNNYQYENSENEEYSDTDRE